MILKSVYQFRSSCVYDGMPIPKSKSELPLAALILQKIKLLDLAVPLTYGKDKDGKKVNHRRYEFKLNGEIKDGWGLFHLYIVSEEHFLDDKGYYYPSSIIQAIPITYKSLNQLSVEEQKMIYLDLH